MNNGDPKFVKSPERSAYGAPLAGRWRRLGAQLIDMAIVLAVFLPVQYLRGAIPAENPKAISYRIMAATIGFVVWLAVNGYYLSLCGQTLGKRILRIKIVRSSGQPASLMRLAFVRYLIPMVTGTIPVVRELFGLADNLLIFRSRKQCLHDVVADTVVVDVQQ